MKVHAPSKRGLTDGAYEHLKQKLFESA
ncbi:MAG: hypothetical protein JWP29_4460, partial [Rhodoferax sp.]|nr:hypothetical protein [Rhodoferax sp.]